ncbi:MAG: flagellar motor switch protein FliN [Candidatus Nanopelagicales bacterium]
MTAGNNESQMALIMEQMHMSMSGLCDALSVTSVVSAGEPSMDPLDIAITSTSSLAVVSVEGTINGNLMVALLEGASPDITTSEGLVEELDTAVDAMSQVMDSEIGTPAPASGAPTIAPDVSVPLLVDGVLVGAVLLFLAPAEDPVEDPVEELAAAPAAPAAFSSMGTMKQMDALAGVQMEITIEVGRTSLPIGQLLQLQPGQIVELDREVGSPLDMFINGTLLAHGEIVVVDDQFGFRVTSVVTAD